MAIWFYRPTPAPPVIFRDQVLPHHDASFLSQLFFHWVTPILKVGYSRPLEPDGACFGVRADEETYGICQRISKRKRCAATRWEADTRRSLIAYKLTS